MLAYFGQMDFVSQDGLVTRKIGQLERCQSIEIGCRLVIFDWTDERLDGERTVETLSCLHGTI